MEKYSQIQKFIPVLMIFIILACLPGCVSTMSVSKSEITSLNNSKCAYIVHGEQVNFLLEQPTISNDTLSGKIVPVFSRSWNKIHLYLLSDSVVKTDIKGEYLSVPLDRIAPVSLREVKRTGPFILGFFSYVALYFSVFTIIA